MRYIRVDYDRIIDTLDDGIIQIDDISDEAANRHLASGYIKIYYRDLKRGEWCTDSTYSYDMIFYKKAIHSDYISLLCDEFIIEVFNEKEHYGRLYTSYRSFAEAWRRRRETPGVCVYGLISDHKNKKASIVAKINKEGEWELI